MATSTVTRARLSQRWAAPSTSQPPTAQRVARALQTHRLFVTLPGQTRARLADALVALHAKGVEYVQEHPTPRWFPMGLMWPFVEPAQDAVRGWNALVKQASKSVPGLSELKLQYGKRQPGLMQSELFRRLGL